MSTTLRRLSRSISTNTHATHATHATLAIFVTATAVVGSLLYAAPAQAATLGAKPDVDPVVHVQRGSHQRLDWQPVRGATAYQIFVKRAAYDQPLPREWKLSRTLERTHTRVYVPQGETRQFGVRAVGRAQGVRKRVTAISSVGTISRPAQLSELSRVRRWDTVRHPSFYRGVAYETRRRGAKLVLPGVRGSSTVRLIGPVAPRFGVVDVYVGGKHARRIDFGRARHNPSKQLVVRIPGSGARDGTVTVVSRSSKPVRISAVGHARYQTTASRRPAAPIAHPPARSFSVTGSGWGHGVGLSQYGAMAMANAGKSDAEILRHYYRGTKLETVADNRSLNVNVAYRSSSVTARLRALAAGAEVSVCAMKAGRCAAQATVTDGSAGSGTAGEIRTSRTGTGAVRAVVTNARGDVKRVTGSWVRIRWSGTRMGSYHIGDTPAVLRMSNGREYRHGEMRVYEAGSGRVNAVVRMKLQDEYLRGVAEVPSSWNAEALQAQAIIARTYALKTGAGLKSDCACNLRDSVVHQAYSGWAKESEGRNASYGRRWVNAVNATDGKVLTYGGALAGTFYYSSSGGGTLNSQDVWSAEVPYLQSVADPWSMTSANANRSWTQTFSQSSMASIFGLANIYKVEVTSTYDGGAARSVTATASNGDTRTIYGKADYIRGRLGLKAAWIKSISANQ